MICLVPLKSVFNKFTVVSVAAKKLCYIGNRRILNLGTLIEALESSGKYDVTIAEFSHGMPFKKQLEIVRKTDILVGVHGAGSS